MNGLRCVYLCHWVHHCPSLTVDCYQAWCSAYYVLLANYLRDNSLEQMHKKTVKINSTKLYLLLGIPVLIVPLVMYIHTLRIVAWHSTYNVIAVFRLSK